MKLISIKACLTTVALICVCALHIKAQTQIFNPTDDAQVYEGNSNNNYGTSSSLQVKKIPGSTNTRITYLKFDLSSYHLSQTGKAVLRVYLRTNDNTVPTIVEALKVNDNSWQENTLTWNNKPVSSGSAGTNIVYSAGSYYEWDVSDYISSLNPIIGNHLFLTIALSDVAESNALLTFNSKEYASNPPELVLSQDIDDHHLNGDFFVDAVNGNDNNSGSSELNPWKTLAKVNSYNFAAGSHIHFKSGQTFPGTLIITGNGTDMNPMIYDTYGGTANAMIDGQGAKTSIYAYNPSYLELRRLTVTNHRDVALTIKDLLHAMVFVNEDAGTLNHIYLDSLDIKDVNSADDADANGTKNHGGVFFNIIGSTVQSKWNDLLVTHCTFENLSRTGINFESDWELRNSNTSFGDGLGDGRFDNWIPSTNIVFRYNTFKHIAGNGLVVRVAINPLIEYNFFDYCGETISGNAAFNFNTDGAIFQFNEATHTVYNSGDTDARGIDSDFRTKNTYIQYNYLHDNGLGGVVATGGDQAAGSTPSIPERFNINTVIRYNIISNNDRQAVSFSGNMKSAEVYNNVFFADNTHNNVVIVRLAQWSVYPQNIHFKNNIFYFQGSGGSYTLPSQSAYSFSKNLFYTPTISSEPTDAGKIKADPLFVSTTDGPEGFKLKPGSPALNVGNLITANGGRDYYNNVVSSASTPNIGAYEGSGTTSLPVTLIDFKANRLLNTVLLTWLTVSEMNNDRFEIERSSDGFSFHKIGKVDGAGDSQVTRHYDFTDHFPMSGNNYYRLKQLDKDGKSSFTNVVAVNYNVSAKKEIVVFPNPTNSEIFVNYTPKSSTETLEVKVYNLQGECIMTHQVENPLAIRLSVVSLKTGIYFLRLEDTNHQKEVATSKFLKY